MKLGIGVDTGGTYTDAVIYDFENKKVIAKSKALTTKENLEKGIGSALDMLPKEMLNNAEMISLSTTLATNACIENKGCRAKLVLLGTTDKVLEWIDAKTVYGLKNEDVLCIDTHCSFDGAVVDNPDWNKVKKAESEWFSDAQALSVAEVYAMHNGAACEKLAKEKLTEDRAVPFVMANELATDLNVMERGATAWLNAKLLTIINEFMACVKLAFEERGITAPKMIVRSDGSLMNETTALIYPVKTILSGPAASIIGGMALTESRDALIIDMGGTTTDISVVKNSVPQMTDGIRISNFRTQIPGVFIDTFGLGGDSRITVEYGKPVLNTRRVQPLCVASKFFPQMKQQLKELAESSKTSSRPLYEFLYLVKKPSDMNDYSPYEQKIINLLSDHPVMLGSGEVDLYYLESTRLEDEGIVMRCGLTPTDIMHVKGDFSVHDTEASVLGLKYMLKSLHGYYTTDNDMMKLCDRIYELACKKLYENIIRVLLINEYPQIFANGLDEQFKKMVSLAWEQKSMPSFFGLDFHFNGKLVGIGAPTHIFLPKVAKVMGVECVIPEHAEVANALGAIIADISSSASIEMKLNRSLEACTGYVVYTNDGKTVFNDKDKALAFAKQKAYDLAVAQARQSGALGQLDVEVTLKSDDFYSKEGTVIDFGTVVTARASGRLESSK